MPLRNSVDAWHDCAVRLVALLRDLPPDTWSRPTDCPRWNVHDVVAHLAAIETALAEDAGTPADASPHRQTVPAPAYTQRGVDERAGREPESLIDELERAVAVRYAQLHDLDVDPHAVPDRVPGGLDWSWQRLLSNRVVDLWVHEQDIRESVVLPGGFDAPAAAHTIDVFRATLPYVLGKKVAPPPGTSVRWTVAGHNAFEDAARVDDTGRATPTAPDDGATARLELTEHAFTRRCAGRRAAEDLEVTVHGDAELGHRTLIEMAIIG